MRAHQERAFRRAGAWTTIAVRDRACGEKPEKRAVASHEPTDVRPWTRREDRSDRNDSGRPAAGRREAAMQIHVTTLDDPALSVREIREAGSELARFWWLWLVAGIAWVVAALV